MYLEHYGFRVLPFENVPDPAFFFDEGDFQRILRRITSAVASGRGLMVVAGPIGSGKTTLSQKIMLNLPKSTVHLWLAEPPGSDRELFQVILQGLGARHPWDTRVLALGVLRDLLLKLHAAGGQCLVVVDESHKFSDEGLEAIRLLNNLEQGASKLIQVLMLGQEELQEMLSGPGHEAFRQRIANLEVLGHMSPPQVRDYVRHRLRVAGGDPGIFPELILDAIAEAAAGIPRLTNSLCDRTLRNAFEAGKRVVDAKDLLQAAEEAGIYRKAFHFVIARARAAADQQFPAPATENTFSTPGASQPVAAAAAGPAEPAPWIDQPSATWAPVPESDTPGEPPRRVLLMPLALLAGGIVALAASLLFYCARAATLSPGSCMAQLVRGIFTR